MKIPELRRCAGMTTGVCNQSKNNGANGYADTHAELHDSS